MTNTTPRTAPTTASGRTTRAPRHRAGRRVTAILAPMSLLFAAAGCGAGSAAQDAPAPLAQAAVADIESPAVDNAELSQPRWIERAYGSDRHFGVITDRVAEVRMQATEGSDRHFGVIADRIADARARAAEGSDRHLVMIAAELAATTERE